MYHQKLFSITAICILISGMFTGITGTQTQTIAVIFDDSEPATKEAAKQIYDVFSKYYCHVDYIPISSVKPLKKELKKQYLGSVYVFHGTPEGMRVGDGEISWDSLSDLLEESPTKWHILESCYSMNISSQNVHGIGAGVDIELAMIDAMHHASEFLGRSGGAEEQTASRGIRKEFNNYVVNNLDSIVRKAFLPEKPLDGSMMDASKGDKNTTYIFTSPWGGNTTICGDWGWIVDKIIWGGEKIGWIETFDKGGKGYLGFKNFTTTKIEAKKPNMGSGDFNFEMPLKFDIKPSLEKGPWYSPEQVKIKITATPKSKIDLAKITGISQIIKNNGYDVKFTLVPKISAGIMLHNFSWQEGPGLEIDSLQFLGGGMSVEARFELYIPISTVIGSILGTGTGTAITNALKLLGIRADVVAIIDFLDSGDYNATIDASETTIMLLFGIGLLIQGNTDTKGSFLKNAIGVDIPVSFFVLGFKVKGDSGFATRAILDSDGARFQVGVPYDLLLDFWARIFFFFKFGWSKEWKDTLWIPSAAKTWTNSTDKGNANVDTDKDGVWNKTELKMGLDPKNNDTDGDGLFDGNELTEYYTNAKLNDSDGDGMDDKEELEYWYVEVKHDPLLDYDNDTLPCLLDYDSDGEGLKDGGAPPGTNNTVSEQLGGVGESTFKTDPTLPDTDFDNLTDYQEVNYDWFTWECRECNSTTIAEWECDTLHLPELGDMYICKATNCTCWSDPLYPGDYECWCKNRTTDCGCQCTEMNKTWIYWNVTDPTKKDTDGDMLMDGYEKEYFETLRVTEYGFPFVGNGGGPYEDFDGDGVVNIIDDDSDNDGLIDGMEVLYGTDPLDIDTDGDYDLDDDGIINSTEELLCWEDMGGGWSILRIGDLNDSGEINGNEWPGYANWNPPNISGCPYPWPVPTNATSKDSDGDGISDRDEWLNHTNPIIEDSDADGLNNTEEYYTYHTNCTNPDTDFDGLRDGFERDYFKNECGITNNTILGEYLNDFDVDDDSMVDGLELVYETDILDPDTDKDGALDGLEFGFYLTDPLNNDTDGDGLLDGWEIHNAGTDPLKVDTDGDGLDDYFESEEHETELLFVGNITYKTDPLDIDTDDDGIADGDEVLGWHWAINRIVTNGLFPSSNDTLWGEHVTPEGEWWQWKWNRERVYDFPDPYRARFQTNPENPDTDRDGLTDGEEKDMVLSPLTNDTDVDGIPDIEEMALMEEIGNETGWAPDRWKGYDIWHYLDFDKDGLTDFNELQLFGNATWEQKRDLLLLQDADGDGLTDWEEVRVPITTYNKSHFNRSADNNTVIAEEQHLFTVSMADANVSEAELNNGTITDGLKAAFAGNGYPLSETSSLVSVTDSGGEWVITDVIADVGTKYMLREETGEILNISGIFYNEIILKGYTDPLNHDSDGDGLWDGDEVKKYGINPLDPDSDHDGITDYNEVITYDTDPLNPDTDSDGPFYGWTDGIEKDCYREIGITDPGLLSQYLNDPDSDNDGIVDGIEFMNSSLNPLYSNPLNPDVNSNGILDGYETDYDQDGLSDWVEFCTAPPGYTLPTYASLNETFNQSESYNASFYNRTIFDPTALQFVNHTIYFINDTDEDGWTDGEEVNIYHTDPLSSSDYPIISPTDNLYINKDITLCPGFYNISDSGEPGVIIINADNVVLDCNGATINGTSGIGIYNPGFDNVTIKNGNVLNYETGILLFESDNSIISNNTVSYSGNQGISIEGSQYCDVYDNRVSFSGGRGITFGAGGNNAAHDNVVYNNSAYGAIEAIHSDNNVIYDNTAYFNEWGIATNHGSNNLIYENTIFGNEFGVYLDWPSTNNKVLNNNISSNSVGIWTNHNSTDNIISGNTIFSNADAGIHIETDNNTITSNKANNNLIGLYLSVGSTGNTVNYNTLCNNLLYDVRDEDSNSGDENTCDLTGNWNDAGTTGCTYACAALTGFDTGYGTYPSIMGNHTGTIKTNHTVVATRMYTYPCPGTGGHTEYARIWNATWHATATWEGYAGDWHNITFDKTVVLLANETYYCCIRTGSYPQIHHTAELEVDEGIIRCDKFTDVNGKVYDDWIPAIKFF